MSFYALHRQHILQVMVLLACCCVPGLGGNGEQFNVQQANIKGEVLILDVGSLSFQGNHPMSPPLNRDSCAEACARTPGCNAWTFCDRKDGCGSGCKAYTAANPPLRSGDNPTIPNPAWKQLKSIGSFGPWGLTSSCKSECDATGGTCKPADRWPNGMCTLKQLTDPRKPEFWSTNAADGWVSGFTQTPPECTNIPARTCTRCIRSKDPANCLKCATSPSFKISMLDGATSSALTKADGCSSCYGSQDPAKCTACLTSNAPCAECALQQPTNPGAKVDVSACVDCTSKHGAKFTASCVSCAALGASAAQVQQCMTCLETMRPLACDKTDYRAGCWNPTVKSSACATCASSARSFDTCLDCMKSKPYSDNCESCTTLPGDKHAQCYKCSKAAGHPGSGCTDCLSYLSDASQQGQCLACLANPAIGSDGKQWCFGCQNWCKTYEARATCVTCLGTKHDSYVASCACK